MSTETEKRMDWRLIWTASGVILSLSVLIIGGFWKMSNKISDSTRELSKEISQVNNEIVKIQTVLILKGIAPPELFVTNEE
jgi:hypothetical protein